MPDSRAKAALLLLERMVDWGFCPVCGCNLANTEGCPWCQFITAARKLAVPEETVNPLTGSTEPTITVGGLRMAIYPLPADMRVLMQTDGGGYVRVHNVRQDTTFKGEPVLVVRQW